MRKKIMNTQKAKSPRQLERHMKGVANHWRIHILFAIAAEEGISLDGIVEVLEGNEKTIGEHTRRLVRAGLVEKTYQGHTVAHTLSPYGKVFVTFLQKFSNM